MLGTIYPTIGFQTQRESVFGIVKLCFGPENFKTFSTGWICRAVVFAPHRTVPMMWCNSTRKLADRNTDLSCYLKRFLWLCVPGQCRVHQSQLISGNYSYPDFRRITVRSRPAIVPERERERERVCVCVCVFRNEKRESKNVTASKLAFISDVSKILFCFPRLHFHHGRHRKLGRYSTHFPKENQSCATGSV